MNKMNTDTWQEKMINSEMKYIYDKLEGLEKDIHALKLILERLDDLLFRKNGGEKALVHVLNRHESFIVQAKSFRRKIIEYLVGFLIGLVSAGVVFWFSVVSRELIK